MMDLTEEQFFDIAWYREHLTKMRGYTNALADNLEHQPEEGYDPHIRERNYKRMANTILEFQKLTNRALDGNIESIRPKRFQEIRPFQPRKRK